MMQQRSCLPVNHTFYTTPHHNSKPHHTMRRVLKPGGYWIHMGPLLWHWADGAWEELSIELSLADVQQAALLMGFKLTSQEFVDAAYIGERRHKAGLWTGAACIMCRNINRLLWLLHVSWCFGSLEVVESYSCQLACGC
jgi:hypothetical protein